MNRTLRNRLGAIVGICMATATAIGNEGCMTLPARQCQEVGSCGTVCYQPGEGSNYSLINRDEGKIYSCDGTTREISMSKCKLRIKSVSDKGIEYKTEAKLTPEEQETMMSTGGVGVVLF